MKNIFVLGMDDFQRDELETVPGAENYSFRSLLGYDELVTDPDVKFGELLDKARRELSEFDGSVDAIVAHWDFPTSVLGPILAKEHGIPAPPLASVLKCEHKYWSRLAQQEVVPECVPAFAGFDPFDDDALSKIDVEFPFWIKPVKAHSSNLGFEIHDSDQFNDALAQIREEIADVGDAFNEALAMVDVPGEVGSASGNMCLAEQFVTGIQAAPEGYVFQGKVSAHGVVDMHKDPNGTSFERLDYPAASVPAEVQERMIDISKRLMTHVGFDNSGFNVEYMWDETTDKIWLIEVNTRISQSHSDLFAKVDGASNHEVAIRIALGEEPRMPDNGGPFAVASQCMVFHDDDAQVTRVPSKDEIAQLEQRIPGLKVKLNVEQGDRLSELPNQDSYRFIIATLFIGGADRDEVERRYADAVDQMQFEFEPAVAEAVK